MGPQPRGLPKSSERPSVFQSLRSSPQKHLRSSLLRSCGPSALRAFSIAGSQFPDSVFLLEIVHLRISSIISKSLSSSSSSRFAVSRSLSRGPPVSWPSANKWSLHSKSFDYEYLQNILESSVFVFAFPGLAVPQHRGPPVFE